MWKLLKRNFYTQSKGKDDWGDGIKGEQKKEKKDFCVLYNFKNFQADWRQDCEYPPSPLHCVPGRTCAFCSMNQPKCPSVVPTWASFATLKSLLLSCTSTLSCLLLLLCGDCEVHHYQGISSSIVYYFTSFLLIHYPRLPQHKLFLITLIFFSFSFSETRRMAKSRWLDDEGSDVGVQQLRRNFKFSFYTMELSKFKVKKEERRYQWGEKKTKKSFINFNIQNSFLWYFYTLIKNKKRAKTKETPKQRKNVFIFPLLLVVLFQNRFSSISSRVYFFSVYIFQQPAALAKFRVCFLGCHQTCYFFGSEKWEMSNFSRAALYTTSSSLLIFIYFSSKKEVRLAAIYYN